MQKVLAAALMAAGLFVTSITTDYIVNQSGAVRSAKAVPIDVPTRATFVGVTSGNVAAATATATIAAPTTAGQSNYLCGFNVRSLGATSSTSVALTITGIVGGTLTYQYLTVAGATTANQAFGNEYVPCFQGTPDTAIVVSLPSLGTGNTNAMVNAWGYRY